MDTQVHQQLVEVTGHLKSMRDLLLRVESKQSDLLHGLLLFANQEAAPAAPPDCQDTLGHRYIQRLISGR